MTTPSTSPAASSYAPPAASSRFVWHDLMTTDAPRATAFYTALFGWTTQVMPLGELGDYTMVAAGEEGVGGIVPLDAAHGAPSHWVSYLETGDVDATCARAGALGGRTLVPPTDIPNVGRFAVVEDPAGAIWSPYRGLEPSPDAPAVAPAGTAAWHELLTTDPEAMAAFYGDLAGWTHETMPMPTGPYWLFRRGGAFAGGMMRRPDGDPSRPHWLVYFAVAGADAAAARIAELGGTIVVPPTDIEDWGRMAVAVDPTGGMFGVLENRKPDTA
ncbi:VOC family protein [Roseisolibacter sp. H3M3-2]|uniref:VOC family protein n=1 Tax=Roseisolibacter sp. H3M3-2 TaxID=3031323 RepID=UPI0023DC8079|nr:VOC family protein [Roseisolibacter sp. H3M3-2]MDF1502922.1 VOC family protein [Roseisolibacter sp. H3M3-2]